jgi:hypothetical protein
VHLWRSDSLTLLLLYMYPNEQATKQDAVEEAVLAGVPDHLRELVGQLVELELTSGDEEVTRAA